MKRIRLERYFAAWWLLWIVWGLAIVVWGAGVWWHRVWLTAFLPPEIWAAFRKSGGLGDTLSEAMIFVGQMAPAKAHWWQSWRALVTGVTLWIAYEAAWTVGYGSGPWEHVTVAVLVAATLFGWLIYHWTGRWG